MINSRKGFTLIEMFIVILVIGILSGIILRGAGGITSSARDTRRVADIRSVQMMLEQYLDNTGVSEGRYPVSGWDNLGRELVRAGVVSSADQVPFDRNYRYIRLGIGGDSYVLEARLERRHRALDGDIDVAPPGAGVTCTDTAPNFFYCVMP